MRLPMGSRYFLAASLAGGSMNVAMIVLIHM